MPIYCRTVVELLSPVERQYKRIRAHVLAEPERYSWRYIMVAALLTRR
jgi:hypothetical protein